MRWIALALVVVGCDGAPRESPTNADAMQVSNVPEGTWEPDPGAGRATAFLVADGSDIWFAYARPQEPAVGEVWLTKTTSMGDVLVPPRRVDSPLTDAWPYAIARTSDGTIAVLWKATYATMEPRVSLFDASGEPVAAQGTPVPVPMVDPTSMSAFALTARPDGSLRMATTYRDLDATTELATVNIDATGTPSPTATQIGTADASFRTRLAATDVGGTTIVAWDRQWDDCSGSGFQPNATVMSTIAANETSTAVTDIDAGGLGDTEPVLAARGTAAYLAWTHMTDAGSVIRLERTSAPGAAVDVGLAPLQGYRPMLAVADDTHGAIAYATYEPAVRIASFTDDNGTLVVGPSHVIAAPAGARLEGIAHVGDQRYTIAWTDQSPASLSEFRVYALTIDLAVAPAPAPAPAPVPLRDRSRRCHL